MKQEVCHQKKDVNFMMPRKQVNQTEVKDKLEKMPMMSGETDEY